MRLQASLLLTIFFCFTSIFASFVPNHILEMMGPTKAALVRNIPYHFGSGAGHLRVYKEGFFVALNWAMEHPELPLLESLIMEGAGNQELMFVTFQNFSSHAANIDVLKALLAQLGHDYFSFCWEDAMKDAMTARKPDVLLFLLEASTQLTGYHGAISDKMEDIVAQYLRITLDLQVLRTLMKDNRFPIKRADSIITASWSDVIRRAIGAGNFEFLRTLLADWNQFKYHVDLSTARHLHFDFSLPQNCKAQVYLVLALECNNFDMAWFLAGRTTMFKTFGSQLFKSSPYYAQITKLIPELLNVNWADSTTTLAQKLAAFIHDIYIGHPNDVDAQTTVLTSSSWKMSITEYLKIAATSNCGAKLLATIKSGRLQIEHLPLIHMLNCPAFVAHYRSIDQYFGQANLAELRYREDSNIIVFLPMFASQVGWRTKRAIKALFYEMRNLGNMELLLAIDKLVEMAASEQAEISAINGPMALSASKDPLSLSDANEAFNLLRYYLDMGNNERLVELFEALPLIRKCQCLLLGNGTFPRPMIEYIVDSISSSPQLYGLIRKELDTHKSTVIVNFLLQFLSDHLILIFIKQAIKSGHSTVLHHLYSFVEPKISQDLWFELLIASKNSSPIFLFLFSRQNVYQLTSDNAILIHYQVLPSAITNRHYEMVEVLLRTIGFPECGYFMNEALKSSVAEGDWDMIRTVVSIPGSSKFDLSFQSNLLLESALEQRMDKIVKRLMTNEAVVKYVVAHRPGNYHQFTKLFPNIEGNIPELPGMSSPEYKRPYTS